MMEVPPPAREIDAVMASLRADASDITVFFQVLSAKLQAAIPESVELERTKGIFKRRRNRPVRRIVIHAGDDLFEAEMHQGTVTCRQNHIVHGIGGGMPFSKELSFDEWLRGLFEHLALRAQTNAAVSTALRSLVT